MILKKRKFLIFNLLIISDTFNLIIYFQREREREYISRGNIFQSKD